MPAFGYISDHFACLPTQLDEARRSIEECAEANGYRLKEIYVEEYSGNPPKIFVLMAALMEAEEGVLIVPTLHHLMILGQPTHVRESLQANGFTVLVSRHPT